jgi:hypothetical protein
LQSNAIATWGSFLLLNEGTAGSHAGIGRA